LTFIKWPQNNGVVPIAAGPPTINAMFSDLQYLVLTIPALLLSLGTQWKVNSTFRRFANVGVQSGYNGAQAAQAVMQSAGVQRVRI
jgi:Zn-dependent membrane protease YugP